MADIALLSRFNLASVSAGHIGQPIRELAIMIAARSLTFGASVDCRL
jgi:hypothetical protein